MREKPILHLLFNHKLTDDQKTDAYKSLGVDDIVYFPEELLALWKNIPSELEMLREYLEPIDEYMKTHLQEGDFLLVQGDFGATYLLVESSKRVGIKPIYATTKREAIEKIVDGKSIKTSVFSHVRFRVYGA